MFTSCGVGSDGGLEADVAARRGIAQHGCSKGACAIQDFGTLTSDCLGWGWGALNGPVPAWMHTRDFGAMCMSSNVTAIR